MDSRINIPPAVWISRLEEIGPDYHKLYYSKFPKTSLNPLRYTYEKLYSEKQVVGLMKAAYYDGYTEREEEFRKTSN